MSAEQYVPIGDIVYGIFLLSKYRSNDVMANTLLFVIFFSPSYRNILLPLTSYRMV